MYAGGEAGVTGAIGDRYLISREFVEAEPLAAVKAFFDGIGTLLGAVRQVGGLQDDKPIRSMDGLTASLVQSLVTAAVAARMPANHPAYFVMIAVSTMATIRRPNAGQTPDEAVREIVRAYAVTFVVKAIGSVTGMGGGAPLEN